jgi:vancomycin permeability regulator SanA
MIELYRTKDEEVNACSQPGVSSCRRLETRNRVSALFSVAARGIALFVGCFSAVNEIIQLRHPGLDLNLCWVDFRPVPAVFLRPLIMAFCIFLIAYAVRPQLSRWRRRITLALTAIFLAAAIWNVLHYYFLLAQETFQTTVPVPLSLFVTGCLGVLILAVFRNQAIDAQGILPALSVSAIGMIIFPLAHIVCFGKTDYSTPADAIVVFGARVYSDGRLSDALTDRVRTACELYRAGLAEKMVLSGGPGDGSVHEAEAMRRFAVSHGVLPDAIILDKRGYNTCATVRNTCDLFRSIQVKRVLAVSHFFHLPRIKMSYHSEGYEAYTVPARETYILTEMPYLIAREVAALWRYYCRFLTG